MTNDGWNPGPLSPADDDEPAFWTGFGKAESDKRSVPEHTERSTGWFRRKQAAPKPDPTAAPGFGTAVPAFRKNRPTAPHPDPATVETHRQPRLLPPDPTQQSAPSSAATPNKANLTSSFTIGDADQSAGFDPTVGDEDVTSTFAAIGPERGTGRLLSATAIMAAGTIVSRILGFVRVVLAAALLGAGTRQADIFSLATTVPNSLYILFAGGALNTVLVPQLVRAVKNDKDGGEAYTNRIMTAFLVLLVALTVILMLAAPGIAWLYSGSAWHAPEVAPQYASMVALTTLCLPQVLFYGLFFLGGQVLNARDAFGPMMWAPIANNVIAVAVMGIYAVVWGSHTDTSQPFSTNQLLLLGIGSVLGIAVQTAVLVPFLRRVGFRYKPRFDLRHTGLGHTFHIAKWTLGFVVVNQIALVVVTKLATSATAGGSGAGETAYNNASLLWVLPHSLITVGLGTAMLPSLSRMAAHADVPGFRKELTKAIRLAMAALIPVSLIFLTLGLPIGELLFRKGGNFVGWTLVMFALGLVPFSIQYLVLRGYYAFEDTKSTFYIQILIAGSNAVFALIAVLLIAPGPDWVAPALAAAYTLAYAVGVVVSMKHFAKHVPGITVAPLLHHLREVTLAALPGTVLAFALVMAQTRFFNSLLFDLLGVGLGISIAGLGFLLMARRMHIEEVEEVLDILMRRIRRRRPGTTASEAPASDALPVAESTPAATATFASETPLAHNAPLVAAVPSAKPIAGDPDADLDGIDEGTPVALASGDVLGGRFRLEEQLEARGSTTTWRSMDQVLSRLVLVHVLSPDNPRAPEIIDTARQAACATDSRFLRVLDAVTDTQLSYIVCEWAQGMELEQLLASGPLTALESAWLVRELADALQAMHSQGLYHTRLTPDTIVISNAGNVKINGFLIDAALHPRANAPTSDSAESDDVVSLGKILYATLASRWPGGPGFGMSAAPTDEQGNPLPPTTVRTGISPTLDRITADLLGGRITSSVQLTKTLTTVLGSADASSDLALRVRYPSVLEASDEDEIQATSVVPVADTGSNSASLPPVFASEETKAHQSPRRMAVVTICLIGLVVLALIFGLINVLTHRAETGGATAGGTSAGSQSSGSSSKPKGSAYPIAGAKDFDPAGDGGNGEEKPELVPLAYDGKTNTSWTTLTYKGKPTFGGLKKGVGYIVDLGQPVSIGTVSLVMVGEPTGLDLRVPSGDSATVTDPPMANAGQWNVVASNAASGVNVDLTPAEPAISRYVMVYITTLPAVSGGFRAEIAEVTVKA